MTKTTTTSSSGGIGFAGLLTIVFIVLKLTHVIDWSWWWVLSPLWISFGLFLALLVVIGVIVGIVLWVGVVKDKRRIQRTYPALRRRR